MGGKRVVKQPRPQGAFLAPPPKPGKSALGTRLGCKRNDYRLSLPSFSFFPPRQLFACLLLSPLPLSESLEQANTLFTYVSCCVSYLSLLMANIKNRKKLQLIQTVCDVMLYSQYFTFHWKLLNCSCKQDTKEQYWGQRFWQMERNISVRPTEMTRPVTVDHLQSWS